jgi:hypothetical protein
VIGGELIVGFVLGVALTCGMVYLIVAFWG